MNEFGTAPAQDRSLGNAHTNGGTLPTISRLPSGYSEIAQKKGEKQSSSPFRNKRKPAWLEGVDQLRRKGSLALVGAGRALLVEFFVSPVLAVFQPTQ
jgi:hypothetical protein